MGIRIYPVAAGAACTEKTRKKGDSIMENTNVEMTPMPRIGDKAPSFKAVTTQG